MDGPPPPHPAASQDDPAPAIGLRVAPLFYRLDLVPATVPALQQFVAAAGDVSDPRTPWFVGDNLITYGRNCGFLTDQRFVAAVLAADPRDSERAMAWRTHTLCWAAESCRGIEGDYVECGTYEGYSMAVVLHYLEGLPERRCWFYDLFDPTPGPGIGKRLGAHAPDLYDRVCRRFAPWPNVTVTRGKVPEVLAAGAPDRIAFLHVDLNDAAAELGALDALFDRVSPGGMIVFDDYGWTGYRAQKAAEDAFLRRHGLPVLELPTGQGLVIKR
ncbi:MAG: class I SAM-dependent methyltransferase [Rhodospirillales bacterium]|nr:class I SAM-dependent methyltransferase [Rhodospirillales bacterium]